MARRPSGNNNRPRRQSPSKKSRRSSRSTESPGDGVRIQKHLAHVGVGSRRAIEEMVEQGRVEVNGQVRSDLPIFVNPEDDEIRVDGRVIRTRQVRPVYFLLNKPKGVVCTSSDPKGRKRAIDFVDIPQRVYCVGRLDADSEGLIVLTNDGELTQHLTHPSHEVPKTYRVTVDGEVTGEQLERIKAGVHIPGGKTQPATVKVVSRNVKHTTLMITLREGRNREIRRILLKLGHKVRRLVRVAIGPIRDRKLPTGHVRLLSRREVDRLAQAGSGEG